MTQSVRNTSVVQCIDIYNMYGSMSLKMVCRVGLHQHGVDRVTVCHSIILNVTNCPCQVAWGALSRRGHIHAGCWCPWCSEHEQVRGMTGVALSGCTASKYWGGEVRKRNAHMKQNWVAEQRTLSGGPVYSGNSPNCTLSGSLLPCLASQTVGHGSTSSSTARTPHPAHQHWACLHGRNQLPPGYLRTPSSAWGRLVGCLELCPLLSRALRSGFPNLRWDGPGMVPGLRAWSTSEQMEPQRSLGAAAFALS